tara:strand:+ start:47 stop:469 length:423 start_codon:yes stop_codon:yes gene_type:complete
MKTDYTYKKGDLIVYVGFVLSDRKPELKFNLGKVVEVGIHELIIEPEGNYFNQHLKVNRNLCSRVNLSHIKNVQKPLPEIGDLVMCYKKNFGDKEYKKLIGHLHEIEIRPGKSTIGKVMYEGKLKMFSLEELIVLEKKRR